MYGLGHGKRDGRLVGLGKRVGEILLDKIDWKQWRVRFASA
jgi:hypothetical protein